MTYVKAARRKLPFIRRTVKRDCGDLIERDYAAGMSIKRLGVKYGVSHAAIWRILKDRNIPRRPTGRYPRPEVEARDRKLVERIFAGEKFTDVISDMGIVEGTARVALKRRGVRIAPLQKARTDARAQACLRRYRAGVSVAEMAKFMSRTRDCIQKLIERGRKLEGTDA